VVICLERGADLHMAQLMPLPLTVSCFSKTQIGFTFLVPAHPGSPGKRAVKRVCVLNGCVCFARGRLSFSALIMFDGVQWCWKDIWKTWLVKQNLKVVVWVGKPRTVSYLWCCLVFTGCEWTISIFHFGPAAKHGQLLFVVNNFINN